MNGDGTIRMALPPDAIEPDEVVQPDEGLGGFATQQLENQASPLVMDASREIRAGMERIRSDYWAGFLSGVVVILGLRYILQGDV